MSSAVVRAYGAQRKLLVDSMTAIRGVLERPAQAARALAGWVIARHGELYAQEYG